MNWLELMGWGPEELRDFRSIGYSYIRQGAYEIALDYFEALTAIDPSNIFDLETLGAIYLQLGNGLQALDIIDKSFKMEAPSLETKLNRAKALFLLGYRRQGLLQAMELTQCEDPQIADQASALILAYK